MFWYILLALVVLLVLITVHEFGHYCAGKIFGFKINEFSIGFGPALFKRTKKDGEIFAVRLLPLGGYCAFEGEDEEGKDKPGAFNTMPTWKRLIVLLSGVTFNFLFGVLIAVIYLLVTGFSTVKISATVVQQGVSTVGFEKGDIVRAVDGKTVEAYRSFSDLIKKYKEGEEITFTVFRDDKEQDIVTKKQKFPAFYYVANETAFSGKLFDAEGNAIPLDEFVDNIIKASTEVEDEKTAGTGLALETYLSGVYKTSEHKEEDCYAQDIKLLIEGDEKQEIYPCISYSSSGVSIGIIQTQVREKYDFFECVLKAWPFCFYLCGLILTSLAGLFTGAISVAEAGGTITAISQIAEISQWGIEAFLLLVPLLAMNLAVFNILPIPSLDGARAVFVLIEMIFRKPVPRKIEGWIHTVGLILLLGLVIFLDINHFVSAAYFLRL